MTLLSIFCCQQRSSIEDEYPKLASVGAETKIVDLRRLSGFCSTGRALNTEDSEQESGKERFAVTFWLGSSFTPCPHVVNEHRKKTSGAVARFMLQRSYTSHPKQEANVVRRDCRAFDKATISKYPTL